MDATALVGIVGIGGTLAGTLIGPWVTELTRRKGAKLQDQRARRSDLYPRLLRAAARLADNASMHAALPLAELEEPASDELERVASEVAVFGSKQVREALSAFTRHVHEFNRRLVMEVQPHHRRFVDEGPAGDAVAIQQRMALGDLADLIRSAYDVLKTSIGKEMGD